MPSLHQIYVVLVVVFAFSAPLGAQKPDTNFPTDDEIRLVLTQAGRAVEQYKPYLDMEQKMLGKTGDAAVAKDRETIRGIEVAIISFGKDPQAFNGPFGFVFFEWLDDASRNALACASSASNDVAASVVVGDKAKVDSDVQLSLGCTNASTLLYTVSENAGALYTRYVQGEEKLAKYTFQVASECADILKKKATTQKQ
jgi:hypothetical protein